MPERDKSRRRGRLLDRTTARFLALGVFLLLAGVVLLIAALNSSGRGAAKRDDGITGPGLPAMPDPPVIDIARLGGTGRGNLGRGENARGTLFDPKNPSRTMGQFEWAAFDPAGPGRARVKSPKATLFLAGGLVAVVSAGEGRIAFSASDQPESGTLEGGVPITLFEGTAETFDPLTAAPLALLFTPTIRFNIPLGEMTLPGEFRMSVPAGELRGRGLRVVADQVASRLELVEIERVTRAFFDPTVKSARSSSGRDGGAPGPAASQPVERGSGPVETFYHVNLDKNVRIARGLTTARADGLDVFMRLVNGALVPEAIGGSGRRDGSKVANVPSAAPADESTAAPTVLAGQDEIAGEPLSLARPTAQAVEMAWDGFMTMTPMNRRPEPLVDNELALVLRSAQPRGVIVADRAADAFVQGSSLTYAATTRDLTIVGGKQEGETASLRQLGKGRIEAPLLTLNLGTGLGAATGPGLLSGDTPSPQTAVDASGETLREIAFAREAGFRLSGPARARRALDTRRLALGQDPVGDEPQNQIPRVVPAVCALGAARGRGRVL